MYPYWHSLILTLYRTLGTLVDMGYLVAMFSVGRLVAATPFGYYCDRVRHKVTMHFVIHPVTHSKIPSLNLSVKPFSMVLVDNPCTPTQCPLMMITDAVGGRQCCGCVWCRHLGQRVSNPTTRCLVSGTGTATVVHLYPSILLSNVFYHFYF